MSRQRRSSGLFVMLPQAWVMVTLLSTLFVSAGTSVSHAQTQQYPDVLVTAKQAAVKVGTKTLAQVPQGRRLRVLGTQGNWYQVQLEAAGQNIEGWIYRTHVQPVAVTQPNVSLTAEDQELLAKAQKLRDQATKLEDAEKYEEMIPLNQEALEIRQKILGREHPDTAEAMWAYGESLGNVDQYDEARSIQLEALAIRKKILGEEHPDTASSLHFLGWLIWVRNHAETQRYFERALAIRHKALGLEHEDTADSFHALGQILREQGHYAASQRNFEQALAIRKKVLGLDHLDTADSLYGLGFLHHSMGQFATARQYLDQALAIHQRLGHQGSGRSNVATILGRVALATEDFQGARKYFDQALSIRQRIYGEDAPATAFSLGDIGYVLSTLGEYAAAKPYFEKVLKICRKTYGEEHSHTITAINNYGILLSQNGDYHEARPYQEKSVLLSEKVLGKEHPKTALAYHNLATLLMDLSDDRAAKPYCYRAVELRRKVLGPRHPGTAESLHNLGAVLGNLGEFQQSLKFYEESLAIKEEIYGKESSEVAHTLNNRGALYNELARHDEALADCKEVVRIRKARVGETHPDTAAALDNLGSQYTVLADYARAREYLNQALTIVQQQNNPLATAQVVNKLAIVNYQTGEFAEARLQFEDALKIRRKLLGEKHELTLATLVNLAHVLRGMGDKQAARELYEQTIANVEAAYGEKHLMAATMHSSLSEMLREMKQDIAAREHLEKALAIRTAVYGEDHPDTAYSLGQLGAYLSHFGEYDRAKVLLEQAIEIYRRHYTWRHPGTNVLATQLAILQFKAGDLSAARTSFEGCLRASLALHGNDHPNTATDRVNLALVHAKLGEIRQATEQFDQGRRSLRNHATRVLPILSQSEQLYFLQSNVDKTDKALSFGLWQRADSDICAHSAAWLLNSKAISHEAIATSIQFSHPQSAEILDQLREVRNQLGTQTLATSEEARQERTRNLQRREEQLIRQLGGVRLGQQSGSDAWVPLDRLRQVLAKRRGAMFINFARFSHWDFTADEAAPDWLPARYAAWIVPPDGQGNVTLVDLGPADAIEEAVAAARRSLQIDPQALREQGEQELEQEARKSLQRLSALVLNPLETQLRGLEESVEVILCPDQSLWLAPWAALPLTTGEYLIQRHPVSFVTSGRELLLPRDTRAATNPPAIFADPNYNLGLSGTPAARPTTVGTRGLPTAQRLVASAAEARAIRPSLSAYSGRPSEMYLDQDATESAFKNMASPRVLVLSTHGFFFKDLASRDPSLTSLDQANLPSAPAGDVTKVRLPEIENPLLRCGLLLAGCNHAQRSAKHAGDDGVLTGLEVLGTNLQGTELVVLSACETGIGDVSIGEGVAGLRQAFQLAGAQSVAATLWQVPDVQTAQLMNDFFKNLAEGQPQADALRQAQLTRIAARHKRSGAAHPFFWAGFTLTGNASRQ